MNASFENRKKLSELGLCEDGIFFYPETDSTNTRAKEALLSLTYPKKPMLFYAMRQTAGRGTKGRSFLSSEETGLWFSLLYTPMREDFDPSGLTAMAAVSVIEGIEAALGTELSEKFYIKWVNDILFGRKKVAGILSERGTARGGFFGYVIGIGINLYSATLPDSISDIAISVEDAIGVRIERERLLYEITKRLLYYLDGGHREEILKKYREKMLPDVKSITITDALGQKRDAEIVGIEDGFALTVRYESGECETLVSADVSIRI